MVLLEVKCVSCGTQPAFWHEVNQPGFTLRCATCAVAANVAAKSKGEKYPFTPLVHHFYYFGDGATTRRVERMVAASPSEWMVFYTENGTEKFCSAGIFHAWIRKHNISI